jgi:hypothetical protein
MISFVFGESGSGPSRLPANSSGDDGHVSFFVREFRVFLLKLAPCQSASDPRRAKRQQVRTTSFGTLLCRVVRGKPPAVSGEPPIEHRWLSAVSAFLAILSTKNSVSRPGSDALPLWSSLTPTRMASSQVWKIGIQSCQSVG